MAIELPWTEKYRPKKLDDVAGHEDITDRLKAYVEKENMPSLLFTGPAGTGKTASALAIGHELFGENFEENFLELNASDERGIDIIRGKIKDFAATQPYGDIDFKIIFLDESDSLTSDAQNALRRTMENYASSTRFILTGNYSSKIIPPIQSRCALFRFNPLKEEKIIERLEYIAEQEELDVKEDAYQALIYTSQGDMRKAINYLQTASTLEDEITEKDIYKIASRARPEEIKNLIDLALDGEFMEARENLDDLLYKYGMSGEDVILQLYNEVMRHEDISEEEKVEIIDEIGEYNFRLTEGANERIQLESLISHLVMKGKKK